MPIWCNGSTWSFEAKDMVQIHRWGKMHNRLRGLNGLLWFWDTLFGWLCCRIISSGIFDFLFSLLHLLEISPVSIYFLTK